MPDVDITELHDFPQSGVESEVDAPSEHFDVYADIYGKCDLVRVPDKYLM